MRNKMLAAALGAAILSSAWPACAQGVKPGDSPTVSAANAGINVLKGNWVRPDGGYVIAIKSIGPGGQLEAMYFNPNPLPFARAQAVQKGTALRVSLELRAGGYSGSTYELTYDPAADRLTGTYYQAVAKQRYEIYFVRK
ncbi:MAG TPA: hypothetical protein VLA64_03725 [Azonexus sp.]|nr:hypothetical protein [Azonexus sp.]